MPVRFYTRVSTEEQAESGLGLYAQGHACVRLAQSVGIKPEDWALDSFGDDDPACGQYTDGGVSAWSIQLRNRPAGRRLLAATKPGDTIIMSRLDRGFRSTMDFCHFLGYCIENNIRFLCGTPRVNLSTANGRAAAQIYAVVAEWESSIKSERIKEGLATKKRMGGASTSGRVGVKLENQPSQWRPTPSTEAAKPVKTGRVHVYARCSHRSSFEEGYSIATQLHSVCDYAQYLLSTIQGLEIGSEFVDGAVSALKNPLTCRPQGMKLDAELKDGDHVVFLRVDRAFGSAKDFFDTIKDWDSRGVTVHFSEDGSCMTDEWGRMLIGVLSHFSEMERRLSAARNRDMRRVLASQGKFCGGRGAPPFWRIHLIKNTQRLIMDHHQFICFRYIRMCMRMGHTKRRAMEMLEEHLARRENRPVIPLSGVMRRGIYTNLPKGFVARRKNGRKALIFPLWNNEKFDVSAPDYEAAISKWRLLTLTEKRRLKAICRKSTVFAPIVKPVHSTHRIRF